MKVLSVNAGSSTLKFELYEMPAQRVLISGNIERIGEAESFYTIKTKGNKIQKKELIASHEEAVSILLKELFEQEVIEEVIDITGIGHRVVHGGDYFSSSVVIDESVVSKIEKLNVLAPLHNPNALKGIRAFQKLLPKATHVAVFDTAFHQTMKEENYLYALPYSWYEDYKVRRYGMHGTSHKYVALRFSEMMERDDLKIITCHIGNGASISAIDSLKCVNTSMGFTPNAGLIMSTRSGDIDASILPYMMEQLSISPSEIDRILNKESGLYAISGGYADSRDIEAQIAAGNSRCRLAQTMLVKRIVDYIAKYYVELGRVDGIIFTAGLGEKAIDTRKEVIEGLSALGIILDEQANQTKSEEICITTPGSTIPCYVIPTNEELMIAKDTFAYLT